MNGLERLDPFLPQDMRQEIEERYYARTNAQARLEHLAVDPNFLGSPSEHVAFFSDHGVVHVRDVALQILQVLQKAAGVLIPVREPARQRFMEGYGVIVAYLHDIGMMDFTPFGRKMHCEYATQAVLGPDLDGFVAAVWERNAGGLARRLGTLAATHGLGQPPQTVLREMLAMANCHSKGAVPVEALNDRERLRGVMQQAAFTSLAAQYESRTGQTAPANARSGPGSPPCPMRSAAYPESWESSFAWLVSAHRQTRQLVDDVIDTLRALRCADALRQRGEVQKTSGSYEVFVDFQTGHAAYAMRYGSNKLYLVEFPERMSAGEANIASSELEASGSLRIAFHTGAFANAAALKEAVASAALVVSDIYADVVGSFVHREDDDPSTRTILLEAPDDHPAFAVWVAEAIADLRPQEHIPIRIVPGLQQASPRERQHYLQGEELDWDLVMRHRVLDKLARTGHKTDGIDLVAGFRDVRLIRLKAGETLLEAGDQAGFVYIPTSAGCTGLPRGGYEAFQVYPWIPLGVTAVLRRGQRNSTIRAEQDTELLMIPREVYLRHWHATYELDEFVQALKEVHRAAQSG